MTRPGTHRCCGGFSEHFDGCPGSRPVVCRCGDRPAISRCQVCEFAQLEVLLTRAGLVAREHHPASAAYARLVASYLDDRDRDDREWAVAGDWMMGREA